MNRQEKLRVAALNLGEISQTGFALHQSGLNSSKNDADRPVSKLGLGE
jgi:hypothetical protein